MSIWTTPFRAYLGWPAISASGSPDSSEPRLPTSAAHLVMPASVAVRSRVLIVEDDPATVNALRAILAHKGWDVTVAHSVAEGLTLLHAQLDCIILDLMLPDGNGAELLKHARDQHLAVRVVVITGTSEPETLLCAAGHQPAAILRKPINLGDLLRAIQPPASN